MHHADHRFSQVRPRRAAAVAFVAVLGLSVFTACASHHPTAATSALTTEHDPGAAPVGPALAMTRLVEGNTRFATGTMLHPRQTAERRTELASTQAPFAVILGCSDSRTSPELVFDQGLGDLFVVRVAGNVIDDHAIGSIEYAVEHLHSELLVVLGHERCGAVKAACQAYVTGSESDDHIQSLLEAIEPAVAETTGQDAEATCLANIRNVVRALRSSEPVLQHAAGAGHLKVVGAYYDLDTGLVAFLPDVE